MIKTKGKIKGFLVVVLIKLINQYNAGMWQYMYEGTDYLYMAKNGCQNY